MEELTVNPENRWIQYDGLGLNLRYIQGFVVKYKTHNNIEACHLFAITAAGSQIHMDHFDDRETACKKLEQILKGYYDVEVR